MPDARLQKMRDVYPEQPQWRRPSDNAAEQLARQSGDWEAERLLRIVDNQNKFAASVAGSLDKDGRLKFQLPKRFTDRPHASFTANVIEGDQH